MADELATTGGLINLANDRQITIRQGLADTASSLDAEDLLIMYETQQASAPNRHSRDKRYFVGHTGIPSTKGKSNRTEEHLAIALCSDVPHLPLGDTDSVTLLDYQVPLKARQTDAGIGKVDLVGVTGSGQTAVIELKVTSAASKGDNPLRALLEALAYCAIVEANGADIALEVEDEYGLKADPGRPALIVMGPDAYWSTWTGTELTSVFELSDRVSRTFGMDVWFIALGEIGVAMGGDGRRPEVDGRVSATVLHETNST